jgi:hypothetical protein
LHVEQKEALVQVAHPVGQFVHDETVPPKEYVAPVHALQEFVEKEN